MNPTLKTWLADAGTLKYVERFELGAAPSSVAYLLEREDDYFIALVGALFDQLREPGDGDSDWALLGNAFAE